MENHSADHDAELPTDSIYPDPLQPELTAAPLEHAAPTEPVPLAVQSHEPEPPAPEPFETRVLLKILMGPGGLRAIWSVLLFILVLAIVGSVTSFVFMQLHLINPKQHFTAVAALFGEGAFFIGLVCAAVITALAERRRGNLLAYNLLGPHRLQRFVEGLLFGFAALSALIGALAWGGWLHFGPIALSGAGILKFAILWGIAFLLVGCVEEGMFRCYLQFTFTRSLNFWWALGIVSVVCAELAWRGKGNGIRGVFAIAALGLIPCMLLHFRRAASSSFWQASWVTSTLFGFVHTGNNGENWIGIFAAAAIGFVFVVSIYVTGSAWWAIGCHAAWDWAETYFYGAADSGNVATGHYLSVTPSGNIFWSGGSDGPEGSALVIAVVLLLLVALVVIYRRKSSRVLPASESLEQAAS